MTRRPVLLTKTVLGVACRVFGAVAGTADFGGCVVDGRFVGARGEGDVGAEFVGAVDGVGVGDAVGSRGPDVGVGLGAGFPPGCSATRSLMWGLRLRMLA